MHRSSIDSPSRRTLAEADACMRQLSISGSKKQIADRDSGTSFSRSSVGSQLSEGPKGSRRSTGGGFGFEGSAVGSKSRNNSGKVDTTDKATAGKPLAPNAKYSKRVCMVEEMQR